MIVFRRPEGNRGPIEILEDKAHTFTVDVYDDDLPANVTAATVTVEEPGGTDIVTDSNVTPAAGDDGSTTNRLAYTLSAVNNDEDKEGFTVTWKATADSVVYWHRMIFDVVHNELYNTVREEDMFQRAPDLRDMRWLDLMEGTADSGTTTTLVDEKLKQFPDDHYNGGRLEIIDGANEGESREVSDFARSTGTVTVGVAFIAAVDSTSVYRLRRSWASLIEDAFEDVRWILNRKGLRPSGVIDSYELHDATLLLSIARAYKTLADNVESAEWRLGREYEDEFSEVMESLRLRYGTGEEGGVEADISMAVSAVQVGRR